MHLRSHIEGQLLYKKKRTPKKLLTNAQRSQQKMSKSCEKVVHTREGKPTVLKHIKRHHTPGNSLEVQWLQFHKLIAGALA